MKKYYEEKSSWLTEIRADREEWVELLGSTPSDPTLRHLGISRRTWGDILSYKCPGVPMAAYRLATFHRHGALSDLLGRAWSDFFVVGDTLVFPGLKQPLSAPELRSTWCSLRELAQLRGEVARLRRELDWVEVSPAVSAWLRRLGMRPSVEVARGLV